MAEVTAMRNNALPYPVYGVPWTIVFPMLDEDGDPVTGLTCDSEISKNGDTGADCTNEATEITYTTATNKGMYYLTLTGTEMTADIVAVTVYSGASTTQATCITLYPRKLPELTHGSTAAGGAAGYITLADEAASTAVDDAWTGCLIVATIDTNTEARICSGYTGSNRRAAVIPEWNVAPDSDDDYKIYLPEGMQTPVSRLSVGTGAGQVNASGGIVPSDMVNVHGSALTETSAGYLAAGIVKQYDVATPVFTAASVNQTIDNPTVGAIATAVWQDATAGDFTTASSIGKSLYTSGVVPGGVNGLFIAGTNAATTITTAGGAALTLSATGANGQGLLVSGNGTGAGIQSTGGATGQGMKLLGGGTSGPGLYAASQGGTGGANYGIYATGNATGADTGGMYLTGGATGGEGLEVIGTGNGHGLQAVGAGSGEGLHATAGGGANGHGAHFEGVGANSHGLLLSRGGSGGDDLKFANNDVTVANVTLVATTTTLTNAPSDSSGVTEILTRLPDATAGAAGGLFIAGSNAATSITTALTANITGNLSGSVGSVTTKTGYALAATGLDAVAVTAPTGVASTFTEMVVQLWRRFFKKATKTATEIKTYDDAGTGALTTQTISDTAGTQTQGESS